MQWILLGLILISCNWSIVKLLAVLFSTMVAWIIMLTLPHLPVLMFASTEYESERQEGETDELYFLSFYMICCSPCDCI